MMHGQKDIKLYLWKIGLMKVTVWDRLASREICYTFSNTSLTWIATV